MRIHSLLIFAACLSTGAWADSPSGFALVERGKARVSIIYGDGDSYAASKLKNELQKYAAGIPLLPVRQANSADSPVRIYLGTLSSNPALAASAASLGWRSEIEKLPPEGYLIRTGRAGGRSVVVVAGGDRTGAIYAASDLKNFYLQRAGSTVRVDSLDYTEVPRMKYRWFWNWDNRSNWDMIDHDAVYGPVKDLPETESVRPWLKRSDAYLKNMMLVIDYMSEHKLNGLIIWGFLRDGHGGIQAAQAVCRYANERGVKIIPGVGIDRHYGGFFHEGNHEFNLETRARQHPALRSVDKKGAFEPRTLCLELPENRDWIRRGFRWLYSNFSIGGVNIEFAEHSTCYNAACVAARSRQPGNETDFAKDLARITPFVMNEIHAVAPTTAASYVIYGGFTREMQANLPEHVRAVPESTICQWTLTKMLASLLSPPDVSRNSESGQAARPDPWPEGLRPPGRNYIGYLHWNAFYAKNQKGFFVDAYRDAARKAFRHGFQGLDTYGEESAEFSNTELSYLAFSEFAYNPTMTGEEFLRKRIAPLYGGVEAGRLVLEIAHRVGAVSMSALPDNVDEIRELAYRGRRLSSESGRARWDKLINSYIPGLQRARETAGAGM